MGRGTDELASRGGAADGLDIYLDELGRHDLLTDEEEERVARRARSGDPEALNRLVRANLRFVVSVAKRYQDRGLSFPDLIQEGNLGLIRAAGKFDPDRGVKFISYAVWWIRQSILAALARHGRSVRLPLNRATELARMNRVREGLRRELGRDPTPREIAREAELRAETVRTLQRVDRAELRLDAPVGEDGGSPLVERFLARESSLEQELEHRILRDVIARALAGIRPRDARVVRMYYGLQGEQERTLEEIGDLLGVTRERVRQLRDRGLREMEQGELGSVLRSFAA